MRLPADAVLLVIDAPQAVGAPRQGADDAPEVEKTSPPSLPPGASRVCRWPMLADNPATLRLLGPPRRSTARLSSSATRRAPSSAPTLKPGSTNSARRPWSFAGRFRPMRSKRRPGTPPISAIRCSSSPTPVWRPTWLISEAGSGRRGTCGPWRWRISRARPRRSSMRRRRFAPPRRRKRGSAAPREGLSARTFSVGLADAIGPGCRERAQVYAVERFQCNLSALSCNFFRRCGVVS